MNESLNFESSAVSMLKYLFTKVEGEDSSLEGDPFGEDMDMSAMGSVLRLVDLAEKSLDAV